jgi:sec-independent protein translocase protein TatA
MLGFVLSFLNIGTPELILILLVALMLFGGEKLPELARGLGKGIRDFKDASEGVKREINNQINNYEEKASAPEQAAPPVVNEIAEATESPKSLIDTTPVAGTAPLGAVAHHEEPHADEHQHLSPEEQKIAGE